MLRIVNLKIFNRQFFPKEKLYIYKVRLNYFLEKVGYYVS